MGSDEETPAPTSPQAQTEGVDASKKEAQAAPTRSWRKKYRKLRHRFLRIMNQSQTYTRDESRALAVARRLQEETDQLLEMLLDVHQTGLLDIPVNAVGIDLGSDVVRLTTAATDETDDAYLSRLLQMPHRHYHQSEIPSSISQNTPSNYMDFAYREEYIVNLDTHLAADDSYMTDPHKILPAPASRVVPPDKELQTINADSVISWLRRNHPETFIQDKDQNDKEKPEPRKRGANKRASLAAAAASAAAKPEPLDDADEENTVIVEAKEPKEPKEPKESKEPKEKTSSRAKRSRDDEPYRPKGGSSRPKRKRGGGDDDKSANRKRTKA